MTAPGFLDLEVTISIQESEGISKIMPFIFNDEGKVIGDMTDEEFEAKRKDLEGKTLFRVLVYCGTKQIWLDSPIVPAEGRSNALAEVMEQIGRKLLEVK